jgi:thioredoxin-dependent peroxiredoxin
MATVAMYGRTYMGMERSSFLVGADGVVRKIWRKMKPEAHAAEVMAAARSMPKLLAPHTTGHCK